MSSPTWQEFDGEQFKCGGVFLPDWLRADLYEHHYRRLEGSMRSIAQGMELSYPNPLGEQIVGFFQGKALEALGDK